MAEIDISRERIEHHLSFSECGANPSVLNPDCPCWEHRNFRIIRAQADRIEQLEKQVVEENEKRVKNRKMAEEAINLAEQYERDVTTLRDQLQAEKVDARRYRWLVKNATYEVKFRGEVPNGDDAKIDWESCIDPFVGAYKPTLDGAIDAALAT